jgi:hypothetical protein
MVGPVVESSMEAVARQVSIGDFQMSIGDSLVSVGDFLVLIENFFVSIGDFTVSIGDLLVSVGDLVSIGGIQVLIGDFQVSIGEFLVSMVDWRRVDPWLWVVSLEAMVAELSAFPKNNTTSNVKNIYSIQTTGKHTGKRKEGTIAKSLSHKIKIPQVPQREKSAKMSRELCAAN